MSDGNKPVTVIARHDVRRGDEKNFEAWIEGITETCSEFPGYEGTEVVRPSAQDEQNIHASIFRFDSYENLSGWMESEVRKEWLEKVKTFSDVTPQVTTFDSLQHWFPRPSEKGPSNIKMSVVTFVAIWPLVHWIPRWVSAGIPDRPLLVEGIATAVIVLLMTYAVMPAATRLAAPWLRSG
jgi:antibiotic biosynthesis monooxygenase (ABM) superfamily enzyme